MQQDGVGQIGKTKFSALYGKCQFFECLRLEQFNDLGIDKLPLFVHRAQSYIRANLETQDTIFGQTRPLNDGENLHQISLLATVTQTESPLAPAERIKQFSTSERLHDLRQIRWRQVEIFGNHAVKNRDPTRLRGDVDQSLNGVLAGAGQDHSVQLCMIPGEIET